MLLYEIIFYSFIAGFSTLLGAYVVIRFSRKAKKYSIYLVSLATGILLTIAFLNVLPEALELNKNAFLYVLLSIFILYFLEQRIMIHACHDDKCETHHRDKAKGTISIMGLGLHSLIDGFIIGASFSVSPALGILVVIGVIAHGIPGGISISSILKYSEFSDKKTLLYSALVAVATPVGAIVSIILFQDIQETSLGMGLALAAGAIIYIGASDLIPETHKKFNNLNTLFLFLGFLLIYLFTTIIHV